MSAYRHQRTLFARSNLYSISTLENAFKFLLHAKITIPGMSQPVAASSELTFVQAVSTGMQFSMNANAGLKSVQPTDLGIRAYACVLSHHLSALQTNAGILTLVSVSNSATAQTPFKVLLGTGIHKPMTAFVLTLEFARTLMLLAYHHYTGTTRLVSASTAILSALKENIWTRIQVFANFTQAASAQSALNSIKLLENAAVYPKFALQDSIIGLVLVLANVCQLNVMSDNSSILQFAHASVNKDTAQEG
jgi:hypothetical protein